MASVPAPGTPISTSARTSSLHSRHLCNSLPKRPSRLLRCKRGMATVKRKGELGKSEDNRKPVYPSREVTTVLWQGKIERLVWGGLGLGRAEDGRAILLSAPLALFPGEEVNARIHWKARHGEGIVTSWVTRDRRRIPAACKVAATCGQSGWRMLDFLIAAGEAACQGTAAPSPSALTHS